MHFIVFERHEAPVVSFHTYVNAGSVDDPGGETGIAHMFEHMAFKGTETIGTKNWPARARGHGRSGARLRPVRRRAQQGTPTPIRKKLRSCKQQLKAAMEKANTYVIPNVYPQLIEENGGVGMNAGTGEDSTNYFYNFPANRLELWFLLESQRFFDPVFREFYKERDVVREERRMRVESSPQGKLVEALLATAFEAHPYRNMPGGWASDIENFRLPEAIQFYKKYYVPANITIAIVGDVDPAECRRLAGQIFLDPAVRPAAQRSPHRRAGAEGREARGGGIARAAIPGDRLQAARSERQGRSGFRRARRDSVGRAHRLAVYRTGARQDRSRWLQARNLRSRAASIPALFLFFLVPESGPHGGRKREGVLRDYRAS